MTNGAKVYVCGLPSDPIQEAVHELNQLGVASGVIATGYVLQSINFWLHVVVQLQANFHSSFSCDLTSKEGILEVSNKIRERESHLDILISNAGIRRDPPQACNVLSAPLPELQASLWSSNYEDWTQSFQVNTMAHYYLSVALLDLLAKAGEQEMPDGSKGREHGRGVVVITSSIASLHNATNVDMMSYATTKAATDHLVSLLAAKFSRWYVRVCGINPGCKFSVSCSA